MHVNDAPVWGDAWYTYDALDNLTSSRITAGPNARNLTHTINPTTNLLDSITNSAGGTYNLAFKYDDLGNVKQRGTQTFTFDLGNRLASASGKGTYVYDGLGHRVSAVGTDGVNWIHVYSQEGQLPSCRAGFVCLVPGAVEPCSDRLRSLPDANALGRGAKCIL